jgi:hypothetical protein
VSDRMQTPHHQRFCMQVRVGKVRCECTRCLQALNAHGARLEQKQEALLLNSCNRSGGAGQGVDRQGSKPQCIQHQKLCMPPYADSVCSHLHQGEFGLQPVHARVTRFQQY